MISVFNSASYGIEESVDIIERMLNQHTMHKNINE